MFYRYSERSEISKNKSCRAAHRGSLRQKRTSTAASAPKPNPPTDRSAARKPQVKHYESQQSRYAPATNPLNLASKHLPYPHPVQQSAHQTTKDRSEEHTSKLQSRD